MRFNYTVLPFQGQNSASAAAQQLQQVLNHYAERGWEFVGVETIDTFVPAGCLGSLFGAKSAVVPFNVVVFRAPA